VKGNQHLHIHRGSSTTKVDIATHGRDTTNKQTNRGSRGARQEDSYVGSAAAARTSHPHAKFSALPNSDVVEKA
jgi:hypothetical protein